MIKKVLLALLLISLLATSAFAWEAFGGRIGIGVKELDHDGDVDGPFIFYDPSSVPDLHLRLAPFMSIDQGNNEDYSRLALAAFYRFGQADVVPYLGLELATATLTDIGTPGNSYNRSEASVILGAEWSVLDQVSLIFDINLFRTYTDTDTAGTVTDHVISYFGNGDQWGQWATIGAMVYLD